MTAPLTLTRPQARPTPATAADRPTARATQTAHSAPARSTQAHTSDHPNSPMNTGGTQPTHAPADAAEAERIAATATSLAVACLEILNGIRRSDSIARWVDRELLAKIDHRAQLRADIAPAKPLRDLGSARALQPLRTHVCRVTDDIAEVTVVVRTPNRCRAVAIRLELLTARWTMTALQTM